MSLFRTFLAGALLTVAPLAAQARHTTPRPQPGTTDCGPRSPFNCEQLDRLDRALGPQLSCDTCETPSPTDVSVSPRSRLPPSCSIDNSPTGAPMLGCANPPLDGLSVP